MTSVNAGWKQPVLIGEVVRALVADVLSGSWDRQFPSSPRVWLADRLRDARDYRCVASLWVCGLWKVVVGIREPAKRAAALEALREVVTLLQGRKPKRLHPQVRELRKALRFELGKVEARLLKPGDQLSFRWPRRPLK